MSKNIDFKLYHGTTKDSAGVILTFKKFIPGVNEDKKDYLGTGIYFFDEPIEALDWNANKIKNNKNRITMQEVLEKKYEVLEAEVSLNEKEVLDLNERKNIILLDRLYEKFESNIKELTDEKVEVTQGLVLDYLFMCGVLSDIKLVKKTFKKKIFLKVKDEKFNLFYRMVYNIKDHSIIKQTRAYNNFNNDDYKEVLYFF